MRPWSAWTRTVIFLPAVAYFQNDMIDAYIELKMEEVTRFRMTTHPIEFDMYYSCKEPARLSGGRRNPPFFIHGSHNETKEGGEYSVLMGRPDWSSQSCQFR